MIKQIGQYSKIENGKIRNETSWQKISLRWKKVILIVKKFLLKLDKSLSLFLRGSIPQGKGKMFISDLDFIILVRNNRLLNNRYKLDLFKKRILKRFSYITNIELSIIRHNKIDKLNQFYLKTMSLNLYNDNVTYRIEHSKLNTSLIKNIQKLYLYQIEKSFRLFDKKDFRAWYRWIVKKIIRLNFTLVSLILEKYSRDLYLNTKDFLYLYPQKERLAYILLEEAIYPSYNHKYIDDIREHLKWLEYKCNK
jgi:hypothetical protein